MTHSKAAAKTKPASNTRDQHDRFVREAIARSLLTLPFASFDARDPFGIIYAYYKKLLDASTEELPTNNVLGLIPLIQEDVAVHEAAGNQLKADVERRWCEGLLIYVARASNPPGVLRLSTAEVVALRKAHEHVRAHMAHQHTWEERDEAMGAINRALTAAKEAS